MNRIAILGDISSWGYSAKWLKNELSLLSGDIEVEISSYGGDVFEGVEMFNELRKYSKEKGKVTTVNKAKAMSIASLIFLAGDTKKAYSNATIMIHKAWTWMAGNADDLLKEAKVLDSIDNVLTNEYSKYMKENKQSIKDILKDEGWYIGQDQMKDTGFVDEFINADEGTEDLAMAKKNFSNSIDKFKAKAKEENVKPNLEIAARAVETLATMPSDSEKIVNSIAGDRMEYNENNFNILVARVAQRNEKIELLKDDKELLSDKLAKTETALETKNNAYKALEEKLSEATANADKMSANLEAHKTSVKEAFSMGVASEETILAMMNAENGEDASKIALNAKEDGSINQGDLRQSQNTEAEFKERANKQGVVFIEGSK